MSLRRAVASLVAAVALAALAGCSAQPDAGTGTPDSATPGAASASELSGTLTIFAAASLTETFDALAESFQLSHPSVEVVLNYAGSSSLAQQILSGAPADIFAAASEPAMRTVIGGGLADDPTIFATNTLELVVPAGNPAGVEGLADLARSELAIALCDPSVPCGAAAETLLAAAGVSAAPDTLEEDVKAVLTKVRLGEADAGLVYVTDVRAAGDSVEGIVLAEASAAVNRYPVAVIADSPNRPAADAWIEMLTGPDGRATLAEAGFGAP